MQFKQTLASLIILVFPFTVFSQTTYLPQDAKENILLERLEIKAQKDSVLNFSKIKPFARKFIIPAVERLLADSNTLTLSKTDQYNLRSLYLDNIEWISENKIPELQSKKPILKNFYQTPANLYEVHIKDFDLIINPLFQFSFINEKDNNNSLFLNSRGLSLRGRISNKIGFVAYLTDNQERQPKYVQAWEQKFQSVPGAGFYKYFKGTSGFDYFDARGYFTFNAAKYIDITFGYDRNFIGNGYRSLFLSDFSNNALFLKLNTRIWKFNYQNLFMELQQTEPRGADRLLRKKYAAFHHLDINMTKWLNVGLFEGIIFGRSNHFEFGYLNPVIFYRSAEQQNGSADNSVAGIDFKANALKKFQFYGQFLLDEFNLKQIRSGNGWWANKWGLQLGAKYIDAFGIKNLDLQGEINRVRPYTYSHKDSVANYTHYNQPLAHPLGANFSEVIGIARYQPAPKWTIIGKIMQWKQGLDTAAAGTGSIGSNIFLPNALRPQDYGYKIISGRESKTSITSLLVSYEFRENLFVDLSAMMRNFRVPSQTSLSSKTTVVSAGIRWNMHRREFDF